MVPSITCGAPRAAALEQRHGWQRQRMGAAVALLAPAAAPSPHNRTRSWRHAAPGPLARCLAAWQALPTAAARAVRSTANLRARRVHDARPAVVDVVGRHLRRAEAAGAESALGTRPCLAPRQRAPALAVASIGCRAAARPALPHRHKPIYKCFSLITKKSTWITYMTLRAPWAPRRSPGCPPGRSGWPP
jgi:hypothetical protein